MFFTKERLKEWLKIYNGRRSLFYEEFFERIEACNFAIEEEPMWDFSFFEDDYYMYKLWLLEHNINLPVVDIGSQLGLQSELFLDVGYIGVDKYKPRDYFNKNHEKVTYIHEDFNDLDLNLSDKVVISNMALSYFGDNMADTVEKLSKAKYLFFNSTNTEYHDELSKRFNNKVDINCKEGESERFYLYFN